MHGLRKLFLLAVSGLAALGSSAASAEDRPVLVELYTSQGCSSCPPADAALTEIARRDDVVALSLHVDYWDTLGWPDPFAQAAFSARQRRLAQHSGGGTIYTPEVFVGGRELRRWHESARFAARLDEIAARPARASIDLAMMPLADSHRLEATATFTLPAGTGGRPRGYVALYEDALVSRVLRGENGGATLHHDRVVRFRSAPLALTAGAQPLTVPIPLAATWEKGKLGLVAVVEDEDSGEILQALALPACTRVGR